MPRRRSKSRHRRRRISRRRRSRSRRKSKGRRSSRSRKRSTSRRSRRRRRRRRSKSKSRSRKSRRKSIAAVGVLGLVPPAFMFLGARRQRKQTKEERAQREDITREMNNLQIINSNQANRIKAMTQDLKNHSAAYKSEVNRQIMRRLQTPIGKKVAITDNFPSSSETKKRPYFDYPNEESKFKSFTEQLDLEFRKDSEYVMREAELGLYNLEKIAKYYGFPNLINKLKVYLTILAGIHPEQIHTFKRAKAALDYAEDLTQMQARASSMQNTQAIDALQNPPQIEVLDEPFDEPFSEPFDEPFSESSKEKKIIKSV